MIRVKWDRNVLHFPLPPANTPLGKLRADIAEYTQLPEESFKLVHAGAVMKDDHALLSAYKIRENSTIALIGGNTVPPAPAPRPPPVKKEPQTEESTINAIHTELNRVRSMLVPDVDAFVLACSNPLATLPSSATSLTPASKPAQETAVPNNALSKAPTPLDHTRLSELLLQSLLRLDALCAPGVEWPDARQQRKAAVREVQGVLDRLDSAWASR
ncbi:hypothetical protein ID866_3774 [Astraeus odoratus]|nr:hypothetical protein ID866_3774 [Astraeus odoratus]